MFWWCNSSIDPLPPAQEASPSADGTIQDSFLGEPEPGDPDYLPDLDPDPQFPEDESSEIETITINAEEEECAICRDAIPDTVVFPCRHNFCKECVLANIAVQDSEQNPRTCTLCRGSIEELHHQNINILPPVTQVAQEGIPGVLRISDVTEETAYVWQMETQFDNESVPHICALCGLEFLTPQTLYRHWVRSHLILN